jgi:hypothetical protein
VDSEAAVADQDESLARVQQMFESHQIRDGHDADHPYVASALRDHVPAGWFGLVKELTEDLIRLGWDRRVLQVKEKFGTLRFYISQREDVLVNRTIAATEQSATVCQDCGEPGTWFEDGGWVATFCDPCRARQRATRGKA